MPRANRKIREEARRLFLTGEETTNAGIAGRVGIKPHTVGTWRKQEDWDGLSLKIDRRAAEKLAEKIANERVTLNLRHYRIWELLLARMAETLKDSSQRDVRTLERMAAILDRAQKGQRVAKGLSAGGETEEGIRAEAQSDIRGLIDAFIDAVKGNVKDEQTREKIISTVLERVPDKPGSGAGESGDEGRN